MIRSIRFTLTIWYVVILALTLCAFGSVLYTNVAFHLKKDTDAILAAQADGISEAIFSFWKAEREKKTGEVFFGLIKNAEKDFSEDMRGENLHDLITRWAEQTDELHTVRPIRIVSISGETLAFSPTLTQWTIPVTKKALERASAGRFFYETFRMPKHRVRLITRPAYKNKHLLYFVQAATSLQQSDASLDRLRLWLCLLIPVTIAFTSAVGWALAGTAMRPVAQMTKQARLISESRLHERLDVPPTRDELERLARTFNEMLTRLERSFRRIRQFSAAASHELRTPLTVMKGEVEWILRKPRAEEEYERVLKTHLDMINELSYIVEQLLAVANTEEGEWAIESKAIDLEALIPEVIQRFEALAAEKNIKIGVRESVRLPVRGEKLLLERLFANLLDNALKHTPAGGNIFFRLMPSGVDACVEIRDTGPGIAAADMPKIFDQFFSRKQNRRPGSTGIGLGLCRWIAEVHHGRIQALNEAGQGAVFRVLLPRVNY